MASYDQVTFDIDRVFDLNASTFNECKFKKITFTKQNFADTKFVLCAFTDCTFENCSGIVTFDNCVYLNTIIKDSTFTDSEMIDCSLSNCSFISVKYMSLVNCELINPVFTQSVVSMRSKTVSKKRKHDELSIPAREKREKHDSRSSKRACRHTCDDCEYRCREEKDIKNHQWVFKRLGLDCSQFIDGCAGCGHVPKNITTISMISHIIGCEGIKKE